MHPHACAITNRWSPRVNLSLPFSYCTQFNLSRPIIFEWPDGVYRLGSPNVTTGSSRPIQFQWSDLVVLFRRSERPNQFGPFDQKWMTSSVSPNVHVHSIPLMRGPAPSSSLAQFLLRVKSSPPAIIEPQGPNYNRTFPSKTFWISLPNHISFSPATISATISF